MTPTSAQTPRQSEAVGSPPRKRLGIGRKFVFAAVTAFTVLAGLDWGTEPSNTTWL
ncbi:MAG: hypothetical protein VX498_15000 [Myxococcota bacterium]|nr:hypothetical protein [Myxococcota bacterium]